MKNIINYIICSMLILGIAACGDMYDVHEKYLKNGRRDLSRSLVIWKQTAVSTVLN